jgi:2,4-dienoyl-CoA reductase-like NADH-dependent reductase (Old Yellow Enzyme family)
MIRKVKKMLNKLFSKITINGKTLKNRCVVTPLLMNLCEEDGTCTERFTAYHEAKAKGGFAISVDSGPLER